MNTAPPNTPLHLLLDNAAESPTKFKITALYGRVTPPHGAWRVLTPAENGDIAQRWQFVCATFPDAIRVMDKWIRGRTVLNIEPAELFRRITGIR